MNQVAMLIDLDRCTGCHTCTVACQTEKGMAPGQALISVLTIGGRQDVPQGTFPDLRMDYLPKTCAHCHHPPCASACPSGALFLREDGLVTVDANLCTGCRACVDACPYEVMVLTENDVPRKCDMCASRLDQGLEPFCVTCCPTRAITTSKASTGEDAYVPAPHFGVKPALRYLTRNPARWQRVKMAFLP